MSAVAAADVPASTKPRRVLTRTDYDELMALVAAAAAAAREAAWATWQQYQPMTAEERMKLQREESDAYAAVCIWAAQRTVHTPVDADSPEF